MRFKLQLKSSFLIGIVLITMSCNKQTVTPVIENFEIKKGTNIAHWLSQSKARGIEREQFFTESDIKNIAEMGFDHIRLPIDEEQMWDENGNRHDDAFQLMKNGIEWSQKYKLRVVLDLHILRSHYFNAEVKPLWTERVEQEKFFDLWRDLSKDLIQYPNALLAYELMNEAVAKDHESWNSLLAEAIAAIRKIEPERTIVVGSNRWQSVETFNALKIPKNDENILLSFHFYKPFLLSHYNAQWTELKGYNGPVHYPGVILTEEEFKILPDSIKPAVEKWVGKTFNKTILSSMLEQPLQKAKALGLPLYCGEFGIITGGPEEDKLRWYEDLCEILNKNDIAYANWNYNSDEFGLTDNGKRNEKMIQIVSGSK